MSHESETHRQQIHEEAVQGDILIGISFHHRLPDALQNRVPMPVSGPDNPIETSRDTEIPIITIHRELFPEATMIQDAAFGLSYIVKK